MFGSTVRTSLVPIAREVILKDLIADLALKDVVSNITGSILNKVNLTVISSSFRDVVKVINGVITPDELQAEIDKVGMANNTFPNSSFVNDQLGIFNKSIDDITGNMTETTTSVNKVKKSSIGVKQTVEGVLSDDNLKEIDQFICDVKTPLHDVYDKYVKLTNDIVKDAKANCFDRKYNDVKDSDECKEILAFADSVSIAECEDNKCSNKGLDNVYTSSQDALIVLKSISGTTRRRRSLADESKTTTIDIQKAVDNIKLNDVIGSV